MSSIEHQVSDRKVETLLFSRGRLFREGLRSGLSHSRFSVTKVIENIAELEKEKRNEAIILIDDSEDQEQAVEVIDQLHDLYPDVPVVVLSGNWEPGCLATYLRHGARAFLLKDISLEALLQSLELVMVGELVLPSQLASHLVNYGMQNVISGRLAEDYGLSEREQQILRCLLNGESNKAIARRLNIADATVKVHMKTLLRKVNVENRTQAAIWALSHGVVSEGSHSQQ